MGAVAATTVSASGNVTANNGMFTNVVNVASHTGAVVSVSGNITGGNLNTSGTLSTSGNIAANNVIATTIVSAATLTGTLSTAAQPNITSVGTLSSLTLASGSAFQPQIISTNYANDAFAPYWTTRKSRANAIVQNGDDLGTFVFQGHDGNAYVNSAYLTAEVDGAPVANTGVVPSLLGFYTSNASTISSKLTLYGNGLSVFSGLVSVTGNVTANNVIATTIVSAASHTGTIVSVTGNVNGGNLISAALVQGATVSSSGNVIAVGVAASGNISATANVQGGNGVFTTIVSAASHTGGLVSVTGTVTGSQFNGSGAGLTSIPGANVTGTVPNATTAVVAGTVTTAAQANITSVGTLSSLAVTANATANNFIATTIVSAASHTGTIVSVTGNVNGGNLISAALVQGATVSSSGNVVTVGIAATGNISATANVQGGNGVFTTIVSAASHTGGLVSVTGTVTGSQFNGSGAGLTSIPGANVTGTVPNATTAVVAGTVTTAAQANITSVGTLTTLNVSGTAAVGNLTTVGLMSATGTVTGSQFNGSGAGLTSIPGANVTGTVPNATTAVVAGTVTTAAQANITSVGTLTGLTINNATTAITNGAANATGNIGSSSVFFNRLFAQATTALYADLAEMYTTDAKYEPGTVLVFGGNQEVTISTETHDHRVAGVVSTNPAHIMNAGLQAEHTVEVALVGRVPVSVIGNISAGDRVVTSNRAGVAEALDITRYQPGVIIGKAVQGHTGNEVGVIEVVVGRL